MIARTLTLISLPLLLAAGPARAQMAELRPNGWVSEGGRILREGDPQPASYMIHPATRADWIGECNNRLAAANQQREPAYRYDTACRAWLAYYESIGAARDGYGFAYAIPVSVTTTLVPCACPPPPVRERLPVRRPVMHDKRVKIAPY